MAERVAEVLGGLLVVVVLSAVWGIGYLVRRGDPGVRYMRRVNREHRRFVRRMTRERRRDVELGVLPEDLHQPTGGIVKLPPGGFVSWGRDD